MHVHAAGTCTLQGGLLWRLCVSLHTKAPLIEALHEVAVAAAAVVAAAAAAGGVVCLTSASSDQEINCGYRNIHTVR